MIPDKVLTLESSNILMDAYKRLWAFENVISTSSHSSNSNTPSQSWLDDAKQLVPPAIAKTEYSRNIEKSLKLDSEINFNFSVGYQLANTILLDKNYDEFQMTISRVADIC